MTTTTFSQFVLLFMFYSIIGWICESIWCSVGERKFINRGFLSGPWCPIYGFGAIIILILTIPFEDKPLLVFFSAIISTSLLEYFTGWLLEALFKTRWWDYSHRRFQIKGRVCLGNSIIFGILGLFAVYLFQPAFDAALSKIMLEYQRIISSAIVLIFLFDLLKTLAATTNLQERLSGLRSALAVMDEYDRHDGNNISNSIQRLREIYANQPDNVAAKELITSVEAKSKSERGIKRLVNAFPTLKPRDYTSEFEALKNEWEQKRRESKSRWEEGKELIKEKSALRRKEIRLSYEGLTITRIAWVFLIGCVVGYIAETVFCFVVSGEIESRQGMLYGPFSQVYGFGAIIMVLLLTPFSRRRGIWTFIGGALLGGAFEALCSIIQESAFATVSWDYSDHAFAFFGGRTSLQFMIFWGIMALAYMRLIYPAMTRLIDRIPKRPKRFFTGVIILFLSVDMLLSAMAVGRWANRTAGIPAKNKVESRLDERYPDEIMEEIYPNMQHLN